jgi:hypothetical protein
MTVMRKKMARKGRKPLWKQFEEAVAQFAAAMDPKARVQHNYQSADTDTGRSRQRDVWIEATVCGVFPIKILVSCKRYKRKLHEGDIDAFIGELSSSGAHKGVIYSFSGFGAPAIEKAKVRGICCCRLYANQPADQPEVLSFGMLNCRPRFQLVLSPKGAPGWGFRKWLDLFELQFVSNGKTKRIVDALTEEFLKAQKVAATITDEPRWMPGPFGSRIELPGDADRATLTISLNGSWAFYEAKCDAILLNGTYSLTSNQFVGATTTPIMDMNAAHPGPGWNLRSEPPQDIQDKLLVVFYGANTQELLIDQLGEQTLVENAEGESAKEKS